MNKNKLIVLGATFVVYLILVSIVKSPGTFMFVSLDDISLTQYFVFALSQLCMGYILFNIGLFLFKLRNHKVYQYTIPILLFIIFVSGGLMLFGSILTNASINSLITPIETARTIELGTNLMNIGIGIFILAFMYIGVFLGIFESLIEKS